MNENTKTLTFVMVAAAVALIAWVSRPSTPQMAAGDMRGKRLFPDFNDPLAATSLEITKYDEGTATISPFKVAQVNNRWSIPSHDNYPADAKDHLAAAATALMGLEVLSVESSSPGDHELYGVIDPSSKSLSAGTTGVGTRVTMKDKDNKTLMDLIVGKQVPDKSELHYVRRANQDPIYVVKAKTDKLSTKFEDWIEKDLLKLNTWDISGVKLHDYSVDLVAGRLKERARVGLEYNDTGDPKWKIVDDRVFDAGKFNQGKLAEDEELNTTKLDDMKNALDDLKIVDVTPKPKGLSSDLKATGSVYADRETQQSLANRGFYLVPVDDKFYELRSNEGETRVVMKDGVEYVLRFGQIAGGASASEKKEEGKEGEKKDGADSGGVNRYLFVMAEFNQDALKKPELEALPEVPAEAPKEGEKKEGEKTAEKKAEGDKTEAKKEEEKKDDPVAKAKAERERIEKENKRKQDEYDEKVKKGQERVKELNDRFADWYYVISDSVYQKIHLARTDVIKKKEKKEEEKKADGAPVDTSTTPAALDELKKDVPAAPADAMKDKPAEVKEAPKADAEQPKAGKAPEEKAEAKAEPAEKKEPGEAAKPAETKAAEKAPAEGEKPKQ
ncbi:MAG: DUF4340 domain-containing protein [Pirellulales bacterium]|nr:DUF4340 domain-containing protein [Pirellulales bacterium]